MKQNNNGLKIAVTILAIVCIVQMLSLSSMNTEIEELYDQVDQLNTRLSGMIYRVNELENEIESENDYMDVSYAIDGDSMDWNNGMMTVKYTVKPFNVSEDTRVIIEMEGENVELTREGDSFVGAVNYPIDRNNYEAIVCLYEGENIQGSEAADWIGAANWVYENVKYAFDGFSAYGNKKLTIAGTVSYALNVDEEIKTAQLVVGEKITELEKNAEGEIPVNASFVVDTFDAGEHRTVIESIFVRIVTQSGITYEIYPYIYGGSNYQVNASINEALAAEQTENVIVTLEDGTKYRLLGE